MYFLSKQQSIKHQYYVVKQISVLFIKSQKTSGFRLISIISLPFEEGTEIPNTTSPSQLLSLLILPKRRKLINLIPPLIQGKATSQLLGDFKRVSWAPNQSPEIGFDRNATGKRSRISHRGSSSKCSTSQSESPQQNLATVKDNELKCPIHSSTPLTQLLLGILMTNGSRESLFHLLARHFQTVMDSYQTETSPALQIHSPTPILDATAKVQDPPLLSRSVEVDDVLGRVILSQANQTSSYCSLHRLQSSYFPDSFSSPIRVNGEAPDPPLPVSTSDIAHHPNSNAESF